MTFSDFAGGVLVLCIVLVGAGLLGYMFDGCRGCDEQRNAHYARTRQLRIEAITACIEKGGHPLECREALNE